MNKRQEMYKKIEEHGQNLNDIFHTEFDNITLCKKLLRLERKAHYATTCLCNTNTLNLLDLNRFTGYDVKQATEAEQDKFFSSIMASVVKILGNKAKKLVFINHDPRGYALKMKEGFVKDIKIYKDFGGYGIIAPDFNN